MKTFIKYMVLSATLTLLTACVSTYDSYPDQQVEYNNDLGYVVSNDYYLNSDYYFNNNDYIYNFPVRERFDHFNHEREWISNTSLGSGHMHMGGWHH